MVSSVKRKSSKSSKLKMDISGKDNSYTSHVNIIVFFLLIGVIIIMIASVVFNLVFLGNDIIPPQGLSAKDSQLTGFDPAKGVVTLQIIEPPEEKNSVNKDSLGRGVDS